MLSPLGVPPAAHVDVCLYALAGRVTFIPLNRLKEKHFKYPEDGSGAVPVISLLSFGKEFKKVS